MFDRGREFHLGNWHVMPLRGVLRDADETRRLTPKAVDVLLCLCDAGGEVVERDELLRAVWGERAVSDEPLTRCIAELRRKLGDERSAPRFIETIPKRGYRLVAKPEPVGDEPPSDTVETQDAAAVPHRRRLAAVAVLAIAALAAAAALVIDPPIGGADGPAIAVLPFASFASAGDKVYFADGIHEETIAHLARVPGLAVRSRTSTIGYRDTDLPMSMIAAELDVDVIVEGSVRHEADRVRVTVQLIDASQDEHLWVGNYEKTLSVENLFAVQREIASAVAGALSVRAVEPVAGSDTLPTSDMAAYEDFMLGKYHYRRQLPGDLEASVGYFESATRRDPRFAGAWDWLAYAYNHAATRAGYLAPAEAYPKARAAALRALEIEPELATAVAMLGYIRAIYDRDWVGAETDLRRALELAPDDTGTVWSLAHVLAILGRHDEAIGLTRALAVQRPDSTRRLREVANRQIDAGRYTEALATLERARALGAGPGVVDDTTGAALFALGQYDAALDAFESAAEARLRAPSTLARLSATLAALGRAGEAEAILTGIEARAAIERISPVTLATALAALGRHDAALTALEQAAANRERAVLGIRHDPFFAALRDHPRFAALVASFDLP